MSRVVQFARYGDTTQALNLSWVNAAAEDDSEPSIVDQVFPELKKLDALDIKELSMTKRVDSGKMSSEQYRLNMIAIESLRDKLTKALDKKGYYSQGDIESAQEAPYEPPSCSVHTNICSGLRLWPT